MESVVAGRCSDVGLDTCFNLRVKLLDGPDKGSKTTVWVGKTTGYASFSVGDHVRVFRNPPPPVGYSGPNVGRYSFSDYDRRMPMAWLAAAFVVLLIVGSRLAGVRALIGLAASLGLVVFFVIPSILAGHSALAVALVGSLAVLLVTVPVSYGLGPKAIAAWLGTALSLFFAVGLAALFTALTHLTGTTSEQAVTLATSDSRVSLRGLLLAGMIVGALGVLVDLTVSQASTVIALRRANRSLGFGGLFRGALGVGHDHIAATVNTLVFAYAGAALPTLLIFSVGGSSFTDAINSEVVAGEVVATLVGAIALIVSMPLTTALAAVLATRMADRRLGADVGHAH
ncbi:MAG TPA: YibE/F family protein [Gaiellaceae bacterium]|nr:YibE/F family protein [Gaiellaceae bacterium]